MPISGLLSYDPAGALKRVTDDMGQDWIKDPIYRSDQIKRLQEDPDRLTENLDPNYQPRRGRPVPVPKTSIAIRPAVDLRLADRVAYQVLVDTFAFERINSLPAFVRGWRYKLNPTQPADLLDNALEWRNYQDLLDAQWEEGCDHILVTDIAGFFQNISHRHLRDALKGIDPDVESRLFHYLRTWRPSGQGLPQRVLGSSLLANAYLRTIDEILGDYRSVRWMDDIAVFCSSRTEGVRAMLTIQEALHKLDLYANEAKTKLVPFDEAENLIIDFRRREIEYLLSIGDRENKGSQGLSDIWSQIVDKPQFADRTAFSFCVTKFAEYPHDDATEEILGAMDRLPHVADHASRYLRTQLQESPELLDRVSSFVVGDGNLFPWQEYRLASLFWHAPSLNEGHLEFIRNRIGDRNGYWAARTVYLRALGKHGNDSDLRVMKDQAETEADLELLRGLLIGAIEAGASKAHAKVMARGEPELGHLVSYLDNRGWTLPPLSF